MDQPKKDNNRINSEIKCPFCARFHRSDAKFCTVTGKVLGLFGKQEDKPKAQNEKKIIYASGKKSDSKPLSSLCRCPNCSRLYNGTPPRFCSKCGFRMPWAESKTTIEIELNQADKILKKSDNTAKNEKKPEPESQAFNSACPYPPCNHKPALEAQYCPGCLKKIIRCADCGRFSDGWAVKCSNCSKPFPSFLPGDWPMFKGNPERSGNSLDRIKPDLELKWSYPLEREPAPIWSSPVVYRGYVYFGSCDRHLHAVNQYNGECQWKRPTNGVIISTPAIWEDHIYVASCDGRIYAQDVKKGGPTWVYPTGSAFLPGNITAPLLACEKGLFVASEAGDLFCLDLKTGKLNWKVSLRDEKDEIPVVTGGPAYHKDRVYAGTTGGRLFCIDASKGSIKWKYPLKRSVESSFLATPAVVAKKCLIPDRAGNFHALSLKDGVDLWNSTVKIQSVVEGSPSVGFGRVLLGVQDQYLIALNLHTGGEVWRAKNEKIRLIDSIFSTPTITFNESVFFGSNSGYIYCRDIENGLELWKYKLDSAVRSAPAVSDGFLYVTTTGGVLYAFKQREIEN